MISFYAIGWFLLLIISVVTVYETIGMRSLVRMFPEGYRAWMPFAQIASLIFFAVMVLSNPWSGWLSRYN